MYYAIYINTDCKPGKLIGPMSWDGAVQTCIGMARDFMPPSNMSDADIIDCLKSFLPVSSDCVDSPYIITVEE